MDDQIAQFKKLSSAFASAAKAVLEAQKAMNATKPVTQNIQTTCEKAAASLQKISNADTQIAALQKALTARGTQARIELEKERALLAGLVAKALQAQGLRVEGNLPLLKVGHLSLEFVFGAKGACNIWFGPKISRLAVCGLDAEQIAAKTCEFHSSLFAAEFDEQAFLKKLRKAYKLALTTAGKGDGDRVPIVALMTNMAFLMQKPTFLTDPRRESFTPYGRVEFAADLSRLKNRTIGEWTLRLDVATMVQTKRLEDHLWIPRNPDGAHYATASFVKVQ